MMSKRSTISKLEKDVTFYREELEEVKIRRQVEVDIYKKKLTDLIDMYNEADAKATEHIRKLEGIVIGLNAEMVLRCEGFFPGHPNDPYIDVSSLIDFPITWDA
jgi:hypothetical protein